MGSLLKETPHSETNATMELLDRWGVTREGLKRFRAASSHEQELIAAMIENGIIPAEQKFVPAPKAQSDLLELVSTVSIPLTTTKFVARKKFVLDTGENATVKVSFIGDNLKAWFLSGAGKIEDPIAGGSLRYAKLRKMSVDAPIIKELGGDAKAETTLTEMYSLMEIQGKGQSGVLLNNSYANIFYIRDMNSVLRTVRVGWGGDGWRVDASSVEDPRRWGGGGRVFSRNSVLESSEPLAPAQA